MKFNQQIPCRQRPYTSSSRVGTAAAAAAVESIIEEEVEAKGEREAREDRRESNLSLLSPSSLQLIAWAAPLAD